MLQKSLGDFCVVYEINVPCDAPAQMAVLYSRLHRNILDVFNEYGVQIMTPAYEGDPEQPKVVPKEQWWTAPAQTRCGRERSGSAPEVELSTSLHARELPRHEPGVAALRRHRPAASRR